MNKRVKVLVSAVLATVMLVLCIPFTAAAAADATISFSDKANRTVFTTEQQVWVQNGITVTNDKGSSTSNVADYAAPARFYKSSTLTIAYTGMMKIVVNANTADYAISLGKSVSGATVNDKTVTITFTEAKNTYSFQLTDGQVRVDSIEVYTTVDGGTPTPTPTPTPVEKSTIAEVLAKDYGTDVKTEGVVTFISGKNVYINDGTGNMLVYTSATVAVGDKVEVEGEFKDYYGKPEIAADTVNVLGSNNTVTPTTVSLADLLADQAGAKAHLSGLVKITGVVLGTTDGDNTPITAGEKSINIRYLPELTGIEVGDTVTVVGVVDAYDGTYQLKVADATAITLYVAEGGSGSEGDSGSEGGSGTQGAGSPDTNDSVAAYIAVAVVALFGIAYVSKKH